MQKKVSLETKHIPLVGERLAGYIPLSPEHARFHLSRKAFRWIFGGNQSSKTYSNMVDLAMIVLNVHPVIHLFRGGLHWACIESWEQVRDILWEGHLKHLIPSYSIDSILWGQGRVPRKVSLKNGHTLEFKAFNQGRELFQGRSIHTCHCDEQCSHDYHGIFTEIQARLLLTEGRIAWSMTPIVPQLELEERMADLPETDDMFESNLNWNRISEGGYIPDERINAMIEEWPEEVQATRIEGRFASYYGAVFKTFNRSIHVIKPFKIPDDWEIYASIDFGFTNPFVLLFAARDKDGRWYLFSEYYMSRATIGQHLATIKYRVGKFKPLIVFADPENAEDRQFLKNNGIPTKLARKNVARGIETVQSKLKVQRDGKPSLFIFNSCRNTNREMAIYRYPTATASRNATDVPVAKDDHTIDALRYMLYSVEKPAKKGHVLVA